MDFIIIDNELTQRVGVHASALYGYLCKRCITQELSEQCYKTTFSIVWFTNYTGLAFSVVKNNLLKLQSNGLIDLEHEPHATNWTATIKDLDNLERLRKLYILSLLDV